MSVKIRWDIPANHPKNCRCVPCLSVTSFDQKPPMTAPIREALSQEDWNRIFMATGFNVLHAHMGKAGDAMKKVGEAAKIAAAKIREANTHIQAEGNSYLASNVPEHQAAVARWNTELQQKTGMSAMRGPN